MDTWAWQQETLRNSTVIKSKSRFFYFIWSFRVVKEELTSFEFDPEQASVMLKQYFCTQAMQL